MFNSVLDLQLLMIEDLKKENVRLRNNLEKIKKRNKKVIEYINSIKYAEDIDFDYILNLLQGVKK